MKKLLAIVSLFFVISAFADAPDPRIRGFLDDLNLKYTNEDTGFFIKDNNVLVCILHKKVDVAGVKGTVIIFAHEYKDGLSRTMMQRMLEENLVSNIGFWGILEGNKVTYKIIVRENCTKQEFSEALLVGVLSIEQFEKKIVRGEK